MQDLGVALLGVFHRHDDGLGLHQVHSAAHTGHQFAWNHPIGDVAVLGHLHSTEDSLVNVTAADHTEGVGGAEGDSAGLCGDEAAAGVDEVRVFLAFGGRGTHTQHTVLGLQNHVHVTGQIVRHHRRQADTQVHNIAVFQFLGDSFCNGFSDLSFIHSHLYFKKLYLILVHPIRAGKDTKKTVRFHNVFNTTRENQLRAWRERGEEGN